MSRLGTENLAYNTLTGSRRHCTLKSRPSLVWHTSQLSPGYCHCFLLYYYFLFSPLFYSTGETTDGYKTGGAAPTPNGQQRRKRKPIKIGVSQCSKSGLQKNNGRIFYSSQYGAFFYFLFRPFFPGPTSMPLTFSQQILRGAKRLHSLPLHPGLPSEH